MDRNSQFLKTSPEKEFTELMVNLKQDQSATIIKVCRDSDDAIFIFLVTICKILFNYYSNEKQVTFCIPPPSGDDANNGYFFEESVLHKRDSFKQMLTVVKNSFVNSYNDTDAYRTFAIDGNFFRNTNKFVILSMSNIHDVEKIDRGLQTISISFKKEAGISIVLKFDANQYLNCVAQQILDHFIYVCKILIDHSFEISFEEIDCFVAEEINKSLLTFAGQRVDFSLEKTVYHYIDEWACRVPEKRALRCGSESVSYKELSEGSVALAAYLQGCGVVPGEAVAILMERGVDMVLCILALWRLGCSYVPISISEPPARIKQILADADVLHVLVNAELTNDYDAKLIDIQEQSSTFASLSPPCFNINELSYIIFTSGSTGRPKGAMIEHLGMMNHLFAKVNDLSMSTETIVAQTASHTFDISVWQFFSALLVGGQTVIYVDDEVKDIDGILKKLETDHVQVLEVVPSYLSILQRLCAEERICFAALTHLLVTGESFPLELAKKWQALYPDIVLVNAYGPTEASDDITHAVLTREVLNTGVVPIGKPIQNTNIYIVDHQGRLCPIGIKGEIWVSGMGVGRGYINDQERTQTSFMRDPFTPNHNIRLYKTGDIGCWLPDGTILFYGRKDEQVKIRGFRIEIGEIENAINDYLGNDGLAAVVYVQEDDEAYLKAYIAIKDKNIDFLEVKKYLALKLPTYMHPAKFMAVKDMPLTINGKIDKNLLSKIEVSTAIKEKAPKNELQKKVLTVIGEVLNFPGQLDPFLNFFEIGGSSLSAIVLLSKINQNFGVRIALKDLMNYANIGEIIDVVEQNQENKKINLIPKAVAKRSYKALKKQEKLFLLQNAKSTLYNIPIVIEITGSLDVLQLNKALRQLVKRHESLRTRFIIQENELYQIIVDDIEVELEVIEKNQIEIDELVNHFIRPFNLQTFPLFRVGVIPFGQNQHVIIFDIHHIISDGISNIIMFEDLINFYEEKRISPLDYHFKDYSEWYNNYQKANAEKLQSYWKKRLGATEFILSLPYDYSDTSGKLTFNGTRCYFDLPSDQNLAVRDLALKQKSTLFCTLMAVFNILLSKICDQEETLIGIFSSGRNYPEFQRCMGMFIDMLPFRIRIEDGTTFNDFLKETTKLFFEDLSHADFEHAGDSFKIDAVFQLQNYYTEKNTARGFTWNLIKSDQDLSKFNLIFLAKDFENKLSFEVHFNNSLFKFSTVKQIMSYYLKILKSILITPDTTIRDINLLENYHRNMRDAIEDDFSYL